MTADWQLVDIDLGKKFIDKASGKDVERPQLQALMNYARGGDTVIVHSMNHLTRNLSYLRQLLKQLIAKQIQVQFIKVGVNGQ